MHSIKKAFMLIIQDHTSFLVIRKLLLSIVIFSDTDKWSDYSLNWTKFHQIHVCRKLFYKKCAWRNKIKQKLQNFLLWQILLGLFIHKKTLGFKKMTILYINSFETFKSKQFIWQNRWKDQNVKKFWLKTFKKARDSNDSSTCQINIELMKELMFSHTSRIQICNWTKCWT